MVKKIFEPSLIASSIFQLSLPLAIYFGITYNTDPVWWLISIFFAVVIFVLIGNNIAMHRYFTHQHFTVSKPVEYFFLWAGSMLGLGSPMSYAITHIVHHKHSDSELDPHGPRYGKRSWLVYFQKKVITSETPVVTRNLLKLHKKYFWMHNYYVPILIIHAVILYLINWKLLVFLWWIPASTACWIVAWTVWSQHVGLNPRNHRLTNIFSLGEGLHKTHHDHPSTPNTAIDSNNVDWTYQASKIFFPKYNFPKK